MIPKIPRQFCNQHITLKKKKKETDQWNQPTYEDAVEVDGVIFQPQTIYSGTNNNRQIIANAVVYFFAGISIPLCSFDKEDVGSIIIFEKKEYLVKSIIDNRDPLSNELYSYELEVL